MTNVDPIAAPKEVLTFLGALKCPICKSDLDNADPLVLKFGSQYDSSIYCQKNYHHYEISLSWEDPKHIDIYSECIEFDYNLKRYIVKIIGEFENGHIINEISVIPIDVDNSSLIEEKKIGYAIPGKLFNLKKFSAKAFVNRINILLTFN